MDELILAIRTLALDYWNESGNDTLDAFPRSIVNFVLEYAIGQCHFPSHFSEDDKLKIMSNFKNAIAMCCVDVLAKSGAEGEISHTENGIVRMYSDSYIDKNLLRNLPNYVTIM